LHKPYAQSFEVEHIDEGSQFSYAPERSEVRIEIDELGIEVADASNPIFQRIVNESNFHAFDMRSPSLLEEMPLELVPETDSFASEATDISAFNANVSIPDSSLGRWLQGRISTQTVWHSFNAPANRRITVGLEYSRGIYDLHLFRRVGNNLVPVDVSWVGNGFEDVHYLTGANGGVYYIAIDPFVASQTPFYFSLIVYVTAGFDAHELNETPATATVFTNAIDVVANIDNSLDIDSFRLNVTTPGFREIEITGAPRDQYMVIIQDVGHNIIGSFLSDGVSRFIDLPAGTFFIRVLSATGFRDNSNYRLQVTTLPPVVQFISRLEFHYMNAWQPPSGGWTFRSGQLRVTGRASTGSAWNEFGAEVHLEVYNPSWWGNYELRHSRSVVRLDDNGDFRGWVRVHPPVGHNDRAWFYVRNSRGGVLARIPITIVRQ